MPTEQFSIEFEIHDDLFPSIGEAVVMYSLLDIQLRELCVRVATEVSSADDDNAIRLLMTRPDLPMVVAAIRAIAKPGKRLDRILKRCLNIHARRNDLLHSWFMPRMDESEELPETGYIRTIIDPNKGVVVKDTFENIDDIKAFAHDCSQLQLEVLFWPLVNEYLASKSDT